MTLPESPPASSDHETTPHPERDPEAAESPASSDAEKLVPVSEAIRYRKRAQTAEQQLNELRDSFTQLQSQLDSSQATITSLERRQKIDALLTDSDAIDLEAARLHPREEGTKSQAIKKAA